MKEWVCISESTPQGRKLIAIFPSDVDARSYEDYLMGKHDSPKALVSQAVTTLELVTGLGVMGLNNAKPT